jgi:hypothetical protein
VDLPTTYGHRERDFCYGFIVDIGDDDAIGDGDSMGDIVGAGCAVAESVVIAATRPPPRMSPKNQRCITIAFPPSTL